MFQSVSDIAAQRVATARESGWDRGTPSQEWPVVGEGAGSVFAVRSADGKKGPGALRTTHTTKQHHLSPTNKLFVFNKHCKTH